MNRKIHPSKKPGDIFYSPGLNHRYKIQGAVCLLYDRENLPYPSCSLQWKGKQPSWRRIGRRFVNDISSYGYEVYAVILLDYINLEQHYYVFTFEKMPNDLKNWWYQKLKPKPAILLASDV